MGHLIEASSSITNTKKLSGSFWTRIASGSPSSPYLFQFGERDGWVGPSSLVWNANRGTGLNGNSLSFWFVGPKIDMSPYSNAWYDFGNTYTGPSYYATLGAIWKPNYSLMLPDALTSRTFSANDLAIQTALGPNKWVHVAFAVDLTNNATINTHNYPASMTSFPLANARISGLTPTIQSGYLANGSQSYTFNAHANSSLYAQDWQPQSSLPHGGGDGEDITIPGSNLSVNSFEFGVPVQTADVAAQPALQMADFQMWFGQYIDWTDPDNFSKVVKITNGVGTPVNPSTAANAFGSQDILFKGNASSFYTNRGSGGIFTQVGTINNFTPTPSY